MYVFVKCLSYSFCFRLFIKKCLGCSERVSPEELVMRASDNIFHLRCFVCVVCGIRLQKGDLYVIKQGQLFCRIDYEKEVEMMQGFGYGKSESNPILQRKNPKIIASVPNASNVNNSKMIINNRNIRN